MWRPLWGVAANISSRGALALWLNAAYVGQEWEKDDNVDDGKSLIIPRTHVHPDSDTAVWS